MTGTLRFTRWRVRPGDPRGEIPIDAREPMIPRLPAMLVGIGLGVAASAAPAASFCNISGANGDGLQFTLRMNQASHVSGSDYMPSAITVNDRRTGASRDYSARHCAVRLFDPTAQIYLEHMRFHCSSRGMPFRNSTFTYDPWKQSFVCTRGCSKKWPARLEFEMCNSGE